MLVSHRRIALALVAAATALLEACSSASTPVTPTAPPAATTIFIANRNGADVLEFPIAGNGNITPSATISGANTLLSTPDSLAVDSNGLIYVQNDSGTDIMVFNATGNVAPSAQITGVSTGLAASEGLAVDSALNIYATSFSANTLTSFPPGSNGNAAFAHQAVGGATGLTDATTVTIYNGTAYVTNTNTNTVVGLSATANGNQAFTSLLSGGATGLSAPFGIAFDASGSMYVANESGNSVTVYAAPYNGNTAPIRTISGPATGLNSPDGVAIDSAGKLYVTNYPAGPGSSIVVFGPGASGNATPIATIIGANTTLAGPSGIALH